MSNQRLVESKNQSFKSQDESFRIKRKKSLIFPIFDGKFTKSGLNLDMSSVSQFRARKWTWCRRQCLQVKTCSTLL